MLQEDRGKYTSAEKAYRTAINIAANYDGYPIVIRKHAYQFKLGRLQYKLGKEHPRDPLFHCKALPLEGEEWSKAKIKGIFTAEFEYNGLLVNCVVDDSAAEYADLLVDNKVIRRIKLSPGNRRFRFKVKRPALSHFKVRTELKVSLNDGACLNFDGSPVALLDVPHGRGDLDLIIEQVGCLDKKGDLPVRDEEIHRRQRGYLELYSKATVIFKKEFKKNLFVMYGTLLGLYREGDFIRGDDDFDVGYVSDANDLQSLKEEVKSVVAALVKAGFTVSFNLSGRPFRLRDSDKGPEIHLDVQPVWYSQGKVWAHVQACLACTLDDFHPGKVYKFRNCDILFPCCPETVLAAYYGSGWRVPDPAYSTSSNMVSAGVIDYLARACWTIREYKELLEDLNNAKGDKAGWGKLFFKSTHDLYPLEEFETNCGWS